MKMKRTALSAGLLVMSACAALAQPAPSFEAASIKPAPPPTDGRLMVMMGGGPGSRDPGRIAWQNVSLKDMLRAAYGVRDYQISGPDWLNSTRFDVTATIKPATTKEEFALMIQGLLKERFGLSAHKEKKDLPAYALTLAKGGSKMPVAQDDPPPTDGGGPGEGAGGPRGGPVAFGGGGRGGPGAPGGPMRNGMMMMRGGGHVEAKGIAVAQLVDMLARQLDRPVEDQTGLTAKYDVKLDYTPDESTPGLAAQMGMMRPMNGGEGPDHNSDNQSPTIFTALQTQLGLKLEPKKLPIDLVIVDHVEKVPTDN